MKSLHALLTLVAVLLSVFGCGGESDSDSTIERRIVWYGEDSDKTIGYPWGIPDNRRYRVCLTNAGNDFGEVQETEPTDWHLYYPTFFSSGFADIRARLKIITGNAYFVSGLEGPAPWHCGWPTNLPNTEFNQTFPDLMVGNEYSDNTGSYYVAFNALNCGGFSCTLKGVQVYLNNTTVGQKAFQWSSTTGEVRRWIYCRVQGHTNGLSATSSTNSCMGTVPTNRTQLLARSAFNTQDMNEMVQVWSGKTVTAPEQ